MRTPYDILAEYFIPSDAEEKTKAQLVDIPGMIAAVKDRENRGGEPMTQDERDAIMVSLFGAEDVAEQSQRELTKPSSIEGFAANTLNLIPQIGLPVAAMAGAPLIGAGLPAALGAGIVAGTYVGDAARTKLYENLGLERQDSEPEILPTLGTAAAFSGMAAPLAAGTGVVARAAPYAQKALQAIFAGKFAKDVVDINIADEGKIANIPNTAAALLGVVGLGGGLAKSLGNFWKFKGDYQPGFGKIPKDISYGEFQRLKALENKPLTPEDHTFVGKLVAEGGEIPENFPLLSEDAKFEILSANPKMKGKTAGELIDLVSGDAVTNAMSIKGGKMVDPLLMDKANKAVKDIENKNWLAKKIVGGVEDVAGGLVKNIQPLVAPVYDAITTKIEMAKDRLESATSPQAKADAVAKIEMLQKINEELKVKVSDSILEEQKDFKKINEIDVEQKLGAIPEHEQSTVLDQGGDLLRDPNDPRWANLSQASLDALKAVQDVLDYTMERKAQNIPGFVPRTNYGGFQRLAEGLTRPSKEIKLEVDQQKRVNTALKYALGIYDNGVTFPGPKPGASALFEDVYDVNANVLQPVPGGGKTITMQRGGAFTKDFSQFNEVAQRLKEAKEELVRLNQWSHKNPQDLIDVVDGILSREIDANYKRDPDIIEPFKLRNPKGYAQGSVQQRQLEAGYGKFGEKRLNVINDIAVNELMKQTSQKPLMDFVQDLTKIEREDVAGNKVIPTAELKEMAETLETALGEPTFYGAKQTPQGDNTGYGDVQTMVKNAMSAWEPKEGSRPYQQSYLSKVTDYVFGAATKLTRHPTVAAGRLWMSNLYKNLLPGPRFAILNSTDSYAKNAMSAKSPSEAIVKGKENTLNAMYLTGHEIGKRLPQFSPTGGISDPVIDFIESNTPMHGGPEGSGVYRSGSADTNIFARLGRVGDAVGEAMPFKIGKLKLGSKAYEKAGALRDLITSSVPFQEKINSQLIFMDTVEYALRKKVGERKTDQLVKQYGSVLKAGLEPGKTLLDASGKPIDMIREGKLAGFEVATKLKTNVGALGASHAGNVSAKFTGPDGYVAAVKNSLTMFTNWPASVVNLLAKQTYRLAKQARIDLESGKTDSAKALFSLTTPTAAVVVGSALALEIAHSITGKKQKGTTEEFVKQILPGVGGFVTGVLMDTAKALAELPMGDTWAVDKVLKEQLPLYKTLPDINRFFGGE